MPATHQLTDAYSHPSAHWAIAMAGHLLLVKYYWFNNYVTVSTCSSESQGSCCYLCQLYSSIRTIQPYLLFPLKHPLHYGATGCHWKFLGHRKWSSFKVIFYRGLTEKSSDNTKLTWHTQSDFENKSKLHLLGVRQSYSRCKVAGGMGLLNAKLLTPYIKTHSLPSDSTHLLIFWIFSLAQLFPQVRLK